MYTSNFGKAFTNGLDIKCNSTTAFHLQSDGQKEQVNQVLAHSLWIYCNHAQQNWSTLLDQAEFTYKNTTHTTTKYLSPFQANYGYYALHPSSIPPKPVSDIPAANTYLAKVKDLQAAVVNNSKKAQAKHAKHYNKQIKEIMGSDDDQTVFKFGVGVF